jgi:hypothetical protein
MKENIYPQNQSQKPAGAPQPISPLALNAREATFAPSPDEVARRAYFTYVNQGSRDGHEVQHWLAAEAELIAERNRTRVHGFHNPT